MRLTFESQHLSLTAFPDVDIPNMTVVVGLNGSGKSHLLQAIKSGAIKNSTWPLDPSEQHDISSTSIKLMTSDVQNFDNNVGYVSQLSPPDHLPHMDPVQAYPNFRHSALTPFRAQLNELCSNTESGDFDDRFWEEGAEKFIISRGLQSMADQVREIFHQAEARLLEPRPNSIHNMRGPSEFSTFTLAQEAAKRTGIPIFSIKPEHLRLFERPVTIEQFSVNLATVFGRYRDARLRNWMMQKSDMLSGEKNSLSDEEFKSVFGGEPWIAINETLRSFSLPYEVTVPPPVDFGGVSVQLLKIGTRQTVVFDNLSSGEKVLTRFAISSFQYDENLVQIRRPKVLLLDEMDGSLHPEMVHRWLRVIQDGLVGEHGVDCILTTHSPTTVALAPEESLFEMKDGVSGLVKVSKQEALNKLTFGVPTLSIDFSGRRQVFTESDTDAAIYERVYSLIKSLINNDRELDFIPTGMRSKDGNEINSGCVIVENIVNGLYKLGNKNVFGIVDWDGTAVSSERVKVIAEGKRDGVENILLDPLLICLLLLKIRQAPTLVADIDRFSGVDRLSPEDLQRMADAVQMAVFPNSQSVMKTVFYVSGCSCNILEEYMVCDDHKLENAILTAFPPLRRFARARGELVRKIVEEVLTEYRMFCPYEIKFIFEEIANSPI